MTTARVIGRGVRILDLAFSRGARKVIAHTPASLTSFFSALMFAAGFAGARAQTVSVNVASRPFPIVEVRLGDVPFAIPEDWVSAGFVSIRRGGQPYVHFVNLHQRPGPTPHFELPRVISLILSTPAPGLAARNLRAREEEQAKVQANRKSDQDGFWQWKPREYLLVNASYSRPLNQPLIVVCLGSERPNRPKAEQRCGVSFYWTLGMSVRYDFYDTDFPKQQWVALDKRVIDLVMFLDGREILTNRK
jgi:hypothetical protein